MYTGCIQRLVPQALVPEMWNGKRMFNFLDCPNCGTSTVPGRQITSKGAKCACGLLLPVRQIRDTHSQSWRAAPRQECSAKCEAATGPNCDCFCEGLNHGRCT